MAFNSTAYMRKYMKQKRAEGVYPTNWRLHKKSKKFGIKFCIIFSDLTLFFKIKNGVSLRLKL